MKIIELFLDADGEDGGIEFISLVDRPAHQSNFLTFSEDDIDVPEFEYNYVGEKYDMEGQIKLVDEINKLGQPVGQLEKDGWYIHSFEPVTGVEIQNLRQKFYTIQSTPNELSAEDTSTERVRYKYGLAPQFGGQPEIKDNSRQFCRDMLRYNRVFRVEDLIAMTDDCTNAQFGCYNILTFRGSFNCRHLFYKYTYRKTGVITANQRPLSEGTPSWAQPSTQVFSEDLIHDEFGVLAVIDGQPLFTHKEDALKMAELLGCEGYHEHKVGSTIGYMACETHEFASFEDYPQGASDNACKVLRWIDEHGRDEVSGMELTGLARANQLCKREPISEDTIARMAGFARHKENSKISPEFESTPWKDKGYVAYLAWGGDIGVNWASRKLKQIRNNMDLENACWPGYEAIGTKDEGGREVPNCVPVKMADEGELNVFGYQTKNFDICPGALGTFSSLIRTPNLEKNTRGMIRSAAVIADAVFKIEKEVILKERATLEELQEAVVLVDDFKDIINEISQDTEVKYDILYMDGHIKKISDYLPEGLEYDVSGLSPYTSQTGNTIIQDSFLRHGFSYDEEKMEITGAAIIPNKMIMRRNPITEELYYVFFSAETTRTLAEKFLKSVNKNAIPVANLDHTDKLAPDTYITESWIVMNKEMDKSAALGLDYPEGTWVVTMKVGDKDLWEEIKLGKYNGYSVEGWFNERMVFN